MTRKTPKKGDSFKLTEARGTGVGSLPDGLVMTFVEKVAAEDQGAGPDDEDCYVYEWIDPASGATRRWSVPVSQAAILEEA